MAIARLVGHDVVMDRAGDEAMWRIGAIND
jgi:hypothetical protein